MSTIPIYGWYQYMEFTNSSSTRCILKMQVKHGLCRTLVRSSSNSNCGIGRCFLYDVLFGLKKQRPIPHLELLELAGAGDNSTPSMWMPKTRGKLYFVVTEE